MVTMQTRKGDVAPKLVKGDQATVTKPKPHMKRPTSVVDKECEAAGKCLLGKPVSKLTRVLRCGKATIESDIIKTYARNKSRVQQQV